MTAHAMPVSRPARVPDGEATSPATMPCYFQVARNVEDVLLGWRLLYRAYRDVDFIRSNPFRIHTVPQAIGEHTAVIVAQSGGAGIGLVRGG